MTFYSFALFLHIVGALGLSMALGGDFCITPQKGKISFFRLSKTVVIETKLDDRSHSPLSQWTRNMSDMCKTRLAPVPKRTAQPSLFVMIKCGSHDDNVSTHRMRGRIWQKQIRPRCLYVWEMF